MTHVLLTVRKGNRYREHLKTGRIGRCIYKPRDTKGLQQPPKPSGVHTLFLTLLLWMSYMCSATTGCPKYSYLSTHKCKLLEKEREILGLLSNLSYTRKMLNKYKPREGMHWQIPRAWCVLHSNEPLLMTRI